MPAGPGAAERAGGGSGTSWRRRWGRRTPALHLLGPLGEGRGGSAGSPPVPRGARGVPRLEQPAGVPGVLGGSRGWQRGGKHQQAPPWGSVLTAVSARQSGGVWWFVSLFLVVSKRLLLQRGSAPLCPLVIGSQLQITALLGPRVCASGLLHLLKIYFFFPVLSRVENNSFFCGVDPAC